MPISRRHFTASLAALAATGCAHKLAPIPSTAQAPALNPNTLRGAATASGLLVGCAVNVGHLRKDAGYAALIAEQANIIVAENAMKFGPLRPTPTTFFFDDADTLAAFAAQHNMKLRGHNFIWSHALPHWFAGYVTKANAEQVLVDHIQTVAGRYRGHIHSWDVVNEAIDPGAHLPGGLRNSPWRDVLPNYIDIAFRTARQADPNALLVYNDYGCEDEQPQATAKRAAVLALVRGMLDRGVPIDAVGLQSHLDVGASYGPQLLAFMAAIRSLGLKLLITELDVNDRALPPAIQTRDTEVAGLYAKYLAEVLYNPDVAALLTWGITDRYTWLDYQNARTDHVPSRPLPFDDQLQPKLAFDAMLAGIKAAPPRSS